MKDWPRVVLCQSGKSRQVRCRGLCRMRRDHGRQEMQGTRAGACSRLVVNQSGKTMHEPEAIYECVRKFNEIAVFLDSGARNLRKNRRHRDRMPFPTNQRIAAWGGGAVPGPGAFEEVECHDLSCRGFSYFYPTEPLFRSLVVILSGVAGHTLYMAAEVRHCREGFWNRQRQFLVGCRFVGKINHDRPPER
jgi:hypothetical protein